MRSWKAKTSQPETSSPSMAMSSSPARTAQRRMTASRPPGCKSTVTGSLHAFQTSTAAPSLMPVTCGLSKPSKSKPSSPRGNSNSTRHSMYSVFGALLPPSWLLASPAKSRASSAKERASSARARETSAAVSVTFWAPFHTLWKTGAHQCELVSARSASCSTSRFRRAPPVLFRRRRRRGERFSLTDSLTGISHDTGCSAGSSRSFSLLEKIASRAASTSSNVLAKPCRSRADSPSEASLRRPELEDAALRRRIALSS
mmetsp:Transcript_85868/g.152079  ORF Transcript_85868/g.152079 Transcript_85868/m.152079 type:complete len:258 (+) Transcript_85868:237-1010(+)